MNTQPKPNALGLASSTASSNTTASPSAAQARRPSATQAGGADQQFAAQAQLAQSGVTFAQSEAALIPAENAKPKPASGSGAAAPDTKTAAPDLKTVAAGGPGAGANAAQLPPAPKVHFVGFDTGGPKAAEYPKRFAAGMDLAQTEAVLADIRRDESRELGAIFDAHGRLARVTLGVAAQEGGPASVDLGALGCGARCHPGQGTARDPQPPAGATAVGR